MFTLEIQERLKLYKYLRNIYINAHSNYRYTGGLCSHINTLLHSHSSPFHNSNYKYQSVYDNMDFLPELLAQKPTNISHEQNYWFRPGDNDSRIKALDKAIDLILIQKPF